VFRYARLNAASEAPEWAHSGIVRYANPHHEQPVAGDHLPYIMGGTCTRPPTPGTLARYRAEGSLTDVSLEKLQNLYRAEGITWRLGDQRGLPTTHILEGGTSLIAPADGTAGYARLFCQLHPPYEPKSEQLKRFMRQREPFAAGGAQAPPDGWPTPDAARPAPRKDTP
jgi:hypothetical protein